MSQIAKLFLNGRSQAVRLPAAFRFEAKEVFVRLDDQTGDVILSRKPSDWVSFFEAARGLNVPSDFLAASERAQSATVEASGGVEASNVEASNVETSGDPFAQWQE